MGFSWHIPNCIIKKEITIKAISLELHYAYWTALFLAKLLPSRASLRFKPHRKVIKIMWISQKRVQFLAPVLTNRELSLASNIGSKVLSLYIVLIFNALHQVLAPDLTNKPISLMEMHSMGACSSPKAHRLPPRMSKEVHCTSYWKVSHKKQNEKIS